LNPYRMPNQSARVNNADKDEELKSQLYQQIGQLKMELDWLKKKLDYSLEYKHSLIEKDNSEITVKRQCQLLGLNRSSFYYEKQAEKEENLLLMRLLDEEYTRHPFYGAARMTAWLKKQGFCVNPKRVRRLLRKLGILAVYPRPNLSKAGQNEVKYPYLLKGVSIERVNQVWSTDITYIRLFSGFIYLAAIMDWYSRYVLSWEVSVTMESEFCLSALDRALMRGCPEIFNSDQGVQFTSSAFTKILLLKEIAISWDGRGRALDNIFVERLWRSVKYEEVYLKDYRDVREAAAGLKSYFEFYNGERLHQSLNYKTPESVYRQGLKQAAFTTLI